MKRFIVFVFDRSAPRGGWDDALLQESTRYARSFDTAEEAARAGKQRGGPDDRVQVVDFEIGEISLEFVFSEGSAEWVAV